MKEATIPSSKTKESDAHTNLASVLLAVWGDAPSRWKVNGLSLKCFFIWAWAGVKISSMYKFALILAPSSTKMRKDFQLSELAAQTIPYAGFWRWKTDFTDVRILSALFAKILSFCKLNLASTVNIFSSEKMISPACEPSFIAFKRIINLSNLFCFCNAVSCCLLVIFKGDNLRSSLVMVLTLFSSISKLLAIFLMLRMGLLLIRSLMTLILNCVQAVRERPYLSRLLHVPSSL